MAKLAAVESTESQPNIIEIKMVLNSEKKHSVRYDAYSADAAVSSSYVMKKDLPKPYPQSFTMKLIFD